MEINTIDIDRFAMNSDENDETIIKFEEIEYEEKPSENISASSDLMAERVQAMLNDHYKKIENLLEHYDEQQKKRHEQTLQMMQSLKQAQAEGFRNEDSLKLHEKPEGFPLRTLKDFDDFEANTEKQLQLKNFLQLIGGISVKDALNHFIKESIADLLVTEFSWSGRSSDHYSLRPMCKTALSKVFFHAVNRCRNLAPCDRCMFEQTMREIIRISKQRVRDMRKRMSGGIIPRATPRHEDLDEFYRLDDDNEARINQTVS